MQPSFFGADPFDGVPSTPSDRITGTTQAAENAILTPEEFQEFAPLLVQWIGQTLQASAPYAQSVIGAGFRRLPEFFSAQTLHASKFVVVDKLPIPPLAQMGLGQFSEFESGDFAGITYLDTFFVRQPCCTESLFFHELIHVLQWRHLGPENFLAIYASGLERFGYQASPLEAMAFRAQAVFDAAQEVFDAERYVSDCLASLAG